MSPWNRPPGLPVERFDEARNVLLDGLLEHGRRRRVFHLAEAGREALRDSLADPTTPEPETRNPALLEPAFADLGAPGQVCEPAGPGGGASVTVGVGVHDPAARNVFASQETAAAH